MLHYTGTETELRTLHTNTVENAKIFFTQWCNEFSLLLWKSEMHIFLSCHKNQFKLFKIGTPPRATTRQEFKELTCTKYVGVIYKVLLPCE